MTMIPSGERVHVVSVESQKPFHYRLPYTKKCTQYGDAAVKSLLQQLVKPKKVYAKIHNYFSQIVENDISSELKDTYLDSLGKVLLSDLWQENIILPLTGGKTDCLFRLRKKSSAKSQRNFIRKLLLSSNYSRAGQDGCTERV